jgi:RNA polymerase sigma factor (sigma-70 family)
MAEPQPRPPLPPDQLLVAELPRIEAVIASVCRRHRCRPEIAEEFAAEVRLKLVADDYAVLRRFEGRADLKTYLTIVIQNFFRDYCDRLWGKWRPSAEAVRGGEVARRLEELLRDGYGVDEAGEILRVNHKVELSAAELEELAARLPPRPGRRFEGEESLQGVETREPDPERMAIVREQALAQQRLAAGLARAITVLPPLDRLVVKLRYERGFPFVDVARTLHLDPHGIYRHVERILRELRGALEREGITEQEVREALGLGGGTKRRGPGRPRRRSVH